MLLVPEALDSVSHSITEYNHPSSANLLSASSRDVLADVRSRDNDLSLANIVVLEKDDLEQVTNLLVIVDDGSNLVDQVNDLLSHPVPRRSLATEDGHPRELLLSFLGSHGLESKVPMNDAKDVQLLPLVLVDTLDLDVKERRGVDYHTGALLDKLGKASLVCKLDLSPLLPEFLVLDIFLNLIELCQVGQELVAARLARNQIRQARVRLVQPTTRSDTVGHVGELVEPKDVDEVLENGGLDQIRVQFSHTVDLVRPDNSEERHANHLGLRLFNNRDSAQKVTVFGEGPLHSLEEEEVDVVDDL